MNGRPEIAFDVIGVAEPKGSMRAFIPKGWKRPIVTSTNKNLKSWESTVRERLQDVIRDTPQATRDAIFDAPIAVTLVFHLPRPKSSPRARYSTKKPDLDKLVRGSLDAMNSVLFRDDAQVVAISTEKRYANGAAKLSVMVEAWNEPGLRTGER